MRNQGDRLTTRALSDRDELAVLARLLLLRVLVTRGSIWLRKAVGDALHACAEHRQ
jgi:hypothetical protein